MPQRFPIIRADDACSQIDCLVICNLQVSRQKADLIRSPRRRERCVMPGRMHASLVPDSLGSIINVSTIPLARAVNNGRELWYVVCTRARPKCQDDRHSPVRVPNLIYTILSHLHSSVHHTSYTSI
jgi:hypothetical protein